jgi:hypothetical protein
MEVVGSAETLRVAEFSASFAGAPSKQLSSLNLRPSLKIAGSIHYGFAEKLIGENGMGGLARS